MTNIYGHDDELLWTLATFVDLMMTSFMNDPLCVEPQGGYFKNSNIAYYTPLDETYPNLYGFSLYDQYP